MCVFHEKMALWEGKSKAIMCQSLSFFLKQETAILRAEE